MAPLCRRLRAKGYRVWNWGYRSLWQTIEQHAEAFRVALEECDEDPQVDRLHVVAHSMGSIVLRVALQKYQPQKLKRIVMLCPPNRGSHAAARFSPWMGWLSTTLTEISDHPHSYVNRLNESVDPRYEMGVIRAARDFVVPHESTELGGVREYIQLPGMHSSVVIRAGTAEAVHRFLQQGSFQKTDPPG